jgi:hypothetical protein
MKLVQGPIKCWNRGEIPSNASPPGTESCSERYRFAAIRRGARHGAGSVHRLWTEPAHPRSGRIPARVSQLALTVSGRSPIGTISAPGFGPQCSAASTSNVPDDTVWVWLAFNESRKV